MPVKFLLLRGVLGFFRRGGWKCQFYFYGRGDFSDRTDNYSRQGLCLNTISEISEINFWNHLSGSAIIWVPTVNQCLRRTPRWAKSPIASVQRTRSTLAGHSAVPCGTNVKLLNANRAIRIAAQRAQGLYGQISVGRTYDRQRTLVIRIAAIIFASDSARTIARFRSSKVLLKRPIFFC